MCVDRRSIRLLLGLAGRSPRLCCWAAAIQVTATQSSGALMTGEVRVRARAYVKNTPHTHFTSQVGTNRQIIIFRTPPRVWCVRWLLGLRLSPGEIRIGRIMLCGYHQYSLRRRIRGIRATATLIDNRDGHNHHQARGEGRRWGGVSRETYVHKAGGCHE